MICEREKRQKPTDWDSHNCKHTKYCRTFSLNRAGQHSPHCFNIFSSKCLYKHFKMWLLKSLNGSQVAGEAQTCWAGTSIGVWRQQQHGEVCVHGIVGISPQPQRCLFWHLSPHCQEAAWLSGGEWRLCLSFTVSLAGNYLFHSLHIKLIMIVKNHPISLFYQPKVKYKIQQEP